MARIAFDEHNVYVNGRGRELSTGGIDMIAEICAWRRLAGKIPGDPEVLECITWLAESGAFELPEHL